jgi:hypothetical protein
LSHICLEQHEFDLAARLRAADFDAVGRRQPPRRHPVVDRCRGRPRNADGFEFGDMLVARYRIAAGPAGDHRFPNRQCQQRLLALRIQRKGDVSHE